MSQRLNMQLFNQIPLNKMLSEEVGKILSSDNELANLSATLQEKQNNYQTFKSYKD